MLLLEWLNTGSMNYARYMHTASVLTDGKVLVAAGYGDSGYMNSAELYDPSTGSWTITGNLNNVRSSHTASVLADGKVLVAGGAGSMNRAELYDPSTGI
ncbi:unnamed protein product [Rotaria sordida]|uniref:Uncharacterized protein n=1 Tax=Rotaria sordida TaxID=392033 RepID=A0A820J9M3_9BILA|nr:unnamed protein product [Rotaria sordida]